MRFQCFLAVGTFLRNFVLFSSVFLLIVVDMLTVSFPLADYSESYVCTPASTPMLHPPSKRVYSFVHLFTISVHSSRVKPYDTPKTTIGCNDLFLQVRYSLTIGLCYVTPYSSIAACATVVNVLCSMSCEGTLNML